MLSLFSGSCCCAQCVFRNPLLCSVCFQEPTAVLSVFSGTSCRASECFQGPAAVPHRVFRIPLMCVSVFSGICSCAHCVFRNPQLFIGVFSKNHRSAASLALESSSLISNTDPFLRCWTFFIASHHAVTWWNIIVCSGKPMFQKTFCVRNLGFYIKITNIKQKSFEISVA